MEQKADSERFWGVTCLHCGKPFPVPTDAAHPANQGPLTAEASERRLFLAWCPVCDREAPYSVSEMARFAAHDLAFGAPVPYTAPLEKAAGAS